MFRAGWTVVQLGLDVTLQTGASSAVLQRMGELGPLGTELVLPALDQYKSTSEPSGPPVHDVCAVAWVAQPGLFGLVPARVQIETAGQLTSGMTRFLEKNAAKGFSKLEDFRGLRRDRVVSHSKIRRPEDSDYAGGYEAEGYSEPELAEAKKS